MKANIHPYQEKGINFLMETPRNCQGGAGLFLDMGLGKTLIALTAFARLKETYPHLTMLVVAPKRVMQISWPTEIKKWDHLKHLTYTIVWGPDKGLLLKKKSDIYLINYEGLLWLTNQDFKAPSILVFDELSKMKAWSSKRMKEFKDFLPTFRVRWGLTGMPMPNHIEDLFSEIYCLDLGTRLGIHITKFRNKYFMPKPEWGHKYQVIPGKDVEIYNKIKDIVFRMDANDYLDLPEEVHNPIYVELSPKTRVAYKEFEKKAILVIGDDIVAAFSKPALMMKLRQFLSGNMYGTEQAIYALHAEKIAPLKELIEELGGAPLLVGYHFNSELEVFKKHFPEAKFLLSSLTGPEMQSIVNDWNEGKIPLLFGHPASIGHGLNLQGACNNLCFFTLDFNLDNHVQFIKRIARQGQREKRVMIHYLLVQNSIEDKILNALREKAAAQEHLYDLLKRD